jgi:hypothetical protein
MISRVIKEMNPGYLSLVLLCITLILFASGWKEIYIRSISHKWLLLFFIGWLACLPFSLTLDGIRFHLVCFWVLAVTFIIFFRSQGFLHRFHLLCISLLLGSFHFLFREIVAMDPIMMVAKPEVDAALLLALAVILTERRALEQIACLSLGILIGDLYKAHMHPSSTFYEFGGPSFQDEWWLSVFAARTVTVMFQSTMAGCKVAVKGWLGRKGGWKK